MRREFERLRGGPFDLLVLGGGIYGAWTAYDAAARGLRVALVEQRDWGAGTSSRSSKLIHGGLRYLEQGRLRLVRRGLQERWRLHELGPHRIRPLRFVMPSYAGDRVGRARLRLGLWLYDRLAGRQQPAGRHEAIGAEALLRRCPFLRAEGLRGGFLFGDCQTDDARLVLELVDGAVASGAAAVNHAAARALLTRERRVLGALVRDEESGEAIEVLAGVTANCTGAWCNRLVEQIGPHLAVPVRLSRGVHLVLPALPTTDALLLAARSDRRVVFLLPWYGRTLLGTTDSDHAGDPDRVPVEASDTAYLLAEANRVLGGTQWGEADVIHAFAGLRALRPDGGRASADVSREWSLEEPLERLLTPIGGKLTSARHEAALLVDRALERLDRPFVASSTDYRPLPWRPSEPLGRWAVGALRESLALGLDEETAELCQQRHGARVARIHEQLRREPGLARRIVPEVPFCLAEVVHAVSDEMARTLEDVLERRVPLLRLHSPSETTLAELAGIAGGLLGWSEERRRAEVDALARPTRRAHETA